MRNDKAIEAVARVIYDQWQSLPGFVPWVEGGNSHKQDEARALARSALQGCDLTSEQEEGIAALHGLVSVKSDRRTHWPRSLWVGNWEAAWARALNAVSALNRKGASGVERSGDAQG